MIYGACIIYFCPKTSGVRIMVLRGIFDPGNGIFIEPVASLSAVCLCSQAGHTCTTVKNEQCIFGEFVIGTRKCGAIFPAIL
jgi:hypothetical protein